MLLLGSMGRLTSVVLKVEAVRKEGALKLAEEEMLDLT